MDMEIEGEKSRQKSEIIPRDANEGCPGVQSADAGKKSGCEGCPNQRNCATGEAKAKALQSLQFITERMVNVKHKIVVLSGKGGVGKSTVTALLGKALTRRGYQVGILDVDICGPSIPLMLGVEGMRVHQSNYGWEPVVANDGIMVMSVGFLLKNRDDAVVWRGPRKDGLIEQFLKGVNWGELDFLIIDTPPGTSDEHISLAQYLAQAHIDGAILVSTPQNVAVADVRKEINFCENVGIRIMGVVENMRGLTAELPLQAAGISSIVDLASGEDMTSEVGQILKDAFPNRRIGLRMHVLPCENGVGKMCKEMNVKYLGSVPMDPEIASCCDNGNTLDENESRTGSWLRLITDDVLSMLNGESSHIRDG